MCRVRSIAGLSLMVVSLMGCAHLSDYERVGIYKRLLSITDSLYVNPVQVCSGSFPPWPACSNTFLRGEIWEGGKAGRHWEACAQGWSRDPQSPAVVPGPDVPAFFSRHLFASTTRPLLVRNFAPEGNLDIRLR